MTNFHEYYSGLLKKLPLSIKKNIWNRLISRLHNPLSKEEASNIHPNIEILLISEVDKYEKKKNHQRCKPEEILLHNKLSDDTTFTNIR
ncbi:13923_t:CDS:1, partial [Ambispora leptoticha]